MFDKLTVLLAAKNPQDFDAFERFLLKGSTNCDIIRFTGGGEVLDFLFMRGQSSKRKTNHPYLLLTDMNLSDISGVELIEKIRANPDLTKLPVMLVNNAEDPDNIDRCYEHGCSFLISSSIGRDKPHQWMEQVGHYIALPNVKAPVL